MGVGVSGSLVGQGRGDPSSGFAGLGWSFDGDGAVGFDRQRPAAFVDEVVVEPAQRDQVVHVGGAAVFPPFDVMAFAPRVRRLATGERAVGAVTEPQGPALGPVGVADVAPGIEHLPHRVDHQAVQPGPAQQTAEGDGVHRGAIDQLTHPAAQVLAVVELRVDGRFLQQGALVADDLDRRARPPVHHRRLRPADHDLRQRLPAPLRRGQPIVGPEHPGPEHGVDLRVDGAADDGAVLGVHLPIEHVPALERARQVHRDPRLGLLDRLVGVAPPGPQPGQGLPRAQEPARGVDPQALHLRDQGLLADRERVGDLRGAGLDQQIDLHPAQAPGPERRRRPPACPAGHGTASHPPRSGPGSDRPARPSTPPRTGPHRRGADPVDRGPPQRRPSPRPSGCGPGATPTSAGGPPHHPTTRHRPPPDHRRPLSSLSWSPPNMDHSYPRTHVRTRRIRRSATKKDRPDPPGHRAAWADVRGVVGDRCPGLGEDHRGRPAGAPVRSRRPRPRRPVPPMGRPRMGPRRCRRRGRGPTPARPPLPAVVDRGAGVRHRRVHDRRAGQHLRHRRRAAGSTASPTSPPTWSSCGRASPPSRPAMPSVDGPPARSRTATASPRRSTTSTSPARGRTSASGSTPPPSPPPRPSRRSSPEPTRPGCADPRQPPASTVAANATRWSLAQGGPSRARGPCSTSSARSPSTSPARASTVLAS